MARKKRKAVKSPPPPSHSAPHAEAGGHSAWLPPALGLLTLILAWLAALGGFADGTTDLRALFNVDSVYPRVQFRAFFGGADESARVSTGPAPYFFPDLLMLYAMAALGVGYASSLYLVPPLQAALSAVGWILVCDFLFGKSPARRFAVLFLHSLPLLIVAWRGADLFHVHLLSLFHYGAWAAMPWLLWFSLRVLESGRGKQSASFPVGFSAWLVVLLSVMVASDLFAGVWFAAPMGAAVVLLAWAGKMERRRAARFVGLLAAGGVVGVVGKGIAPLLGMESVDPSLDLSAEKFFRSLGLLARHCWNAAVRHPAEAAAWVVFSALAFWRGTAVFNSSLRRRTPKALGVSDGLRHSVAAVFVPAAMLSAPALVSAAGLTSGFFTYLNPESPSYRTVGTELRYFMPLLFFPLFVGWALLPGIRFGAGVLFAAAALAAALAAPKAARIDFASLDPYGTPFFKCFAENARRLNWRSGIGAVNFATIFAETPGTDIGRMMAVGTFRRPDAGESFMVVDSNFNLNLSGEYQFAVVNGHNGRVFESPPLAGETGCAMDAPETCWHPINNYTMDDASVRAAFGAPREEINCAGVGLFHYDPPLKFDFSHLEHPYLAPVARW